ncbi:MAG: right-handed parallel beta-helix repeat-containing protein [Parvibaculaceae bacterium]
MSRVSGNPQSAPIRTLVKGAARAALISVSVAGMVLPAFGAPEAPRWHPWIEAAGFLSSERDRGEMSGFIPLYQDGTQLIFADIKGKLFTDSVKEGNFALGYRQMTNWGLNLGGWAGYDIRRSEYGNSFAQTSFGIEALSADYDLRLNGYVPLSDDKVANGLARAELSGSQIFISGGQEVPLAGFDGEAGWRVPIERFLDRTDHHELRLYAGGFYFDDAKIDRALAGPRLRAEWRLFDFVDEIPGMRLAFETEVQHDDYRDGQVEAGVRLRIPLFGTTTSSPLNPLERRMMEAIERDTDIVTAGTKREAVLDARSGVRLTNVETMDGNDDLTTASASAGANTLLIVDGGNGDIVGTNTITASNQTLAGGGTALTLRGENSGAIATLTLPGTPPTLMTSGCFCGDILTLDGGSNLHVSGLTLDGDAGLAGAGVVIGSNQRNLHLTDLSALDLSGPGVAMVDGNDVTIDGLTVLQNGFGGVFAWDNNTITLKNSTLRDITGNGIDMLSGNRLALENVQIDNMVFSAGISGADDNIITGRGLSVMQTAGPAFDLTDNNSLTLSNFTVQDAGFGALFINDGNTVLITGAQILDSGSDAVFIDDDNSVTLIDTQIARADGSGIELGSRNTLVVRGSGISDTTGDAIDLRDDNTLEISTTRFAGDIGDDLFDFDGTGNAFVSSTGNRNDTTSLGGRLCDIVGGGFSGTLSFADNTVLQDGVAPCL